MEASNIYGLRAVGQELVLCRHVRFQGRAQPVVDVLKVRSAMAVRRVRIPTVVPPACRVVAFRHDAVAVPTDGVHRVDHGSQRFFQQSR